MAVAEARSRSSPRRDLAAVHGLIGLVAIDAAYWAAARDAFENEVAIAKRCVGAKGAVDIRGVLEEGLRGLARCHRALGDEAAAKECEEQIARLDDAP